jgi:branched-subunit amino acid ABC-type transport system permease component
MGLLLDVLYSAALTAFLSFGFFLALKYARVFLMSYGEVVVLGAFVSTFLTAGFANWALALLAAAVAGAVVGAVNFVLLQGAFQRGRTIEALLLTWGSALVLMELYRLAFGAAGRFAPSFFDTVWTVGGAPFPLSRVMSLAAIAMASAIILLSLRALNARQSLTALAYGHQVAGEYGVPVPKLLLATLVIACAAGAVAGVLIGQEAAITPYGGIQYTIIAALSAMVAGARVTNGVMVAAALGGARTWLGYEFGLTPAWLIVLALVVMAASMRRGPVVSYDAQR